MSSDAVSRETVRLHLAGLLEAALSGDGKPVQKVYDHEPSSFETNNPVICVASGAPHRGGQDDKEKDFTTFGLWVHVFVLYSDVESNFTEEDCAHAVDVIEKGIADVVRDNSMPGEESWFILSHAGEGPGPEPLEIDGVEYSHEVIPLKATCYDPWEH